MAVDAAVSAAQSGDAAAFNDATANLSRFDREQLAVLLGAITRDLLERSHPDGLDSEGAEQVLQSCIRSAACWYEGVDSDSLVGALLPRWHQQPRRTTAARRHRRGDTRLAADRGPAQDPGPRAAAHSRPRASRVIASKLSSFRDPARTRARQLDGPPGHLVRLSSALGYPGTGMRWRVAASATLLHQALADWRRREDGQRPRDESAVKAGRGEPGGKLKMSRRASPSRVLRGMRRAVSRGGRSRSDHGLAVLGA